MDKYSMSAFCMFRVTNPDDICTIEQNFPKRVQIHNSFELEDYLKNRVKSACRKGKVALALSGGIDSAILAKYMPNGTTAYTFKCVVPGVNVTDETIMAAEYAKECGLKHKIVEIYWEDYEQLSPILMKNRRAPIHSIEVQIYKAALQAKEDGFDTLIFGEAADAVYGGLSGLLSKDWAIGDFIQRYSYVLPYQVLKKSEMVLGPYERFCNNGIIDPHKFISEFFIQESVSSYINAVKTADCNLVLPYPETKLADPIDYTRIRNGENKYIVREIFKRLYPGFIIPPKTPMPRPMGEWLKEWDGPERDEFWPHCAKNMSGDQKWLLWILEQYLNQLDAS